jgi:hypothetical protein
MSCFNTCLSGINLIPTDSDIVPVFCKELVLGVSLDDRTFSYPNISCKNMHTVLNMLNVMVFLRYWFSAHRHLASGSFSPAADGKMMEWLADYVCYRLQNSVR